MTRFLDTLPESDICFLYFGTKTIHEEAEVVPLINMLCKEWNTDACDEPVYVAHNSRSSDGFVYMYRDSEIRYRAFLDDNKITAFERENQSIRGTQLGGVGKNTLSHVRLGNHLTVGLMNSFVTKRLMLNTHKTIYTPDEDQPNRTQTNYCECNVYFDEPLTESSQCIMNGTPMGVSIGHTYTNIVKDAAIVGLVKACKHIYINAVDGVHHSTGGSGQRIHVGPRGGTYVWSSSGVHRRKRYLQKGGVGSFTNDSGRAFSDTFVEFLRTIVAVPVLQLQPYLSNIIVVYDKSCDALMLRYNYGTRDLSDSDFCFVDIGMAQRAFSYFVMDPNEKAAMDSASRQDAVAFLDSFQRTTAPRPEVVYVHD